MVKLAPSLTPPVDLVPAERRRESQVLPEGAPLPQTGPATNRDLERRDVLRKLTEQQTIPTTNVPGSPITSLPSQPTAAPPLEVPSSALKPPTEETSLVTGTARAPSGFFSQLKDKLLQMTGLGGSTKNSEGAEEGQGLLSRVSNQLSKLSEVRSLSGLLSWGKEMACAVVPGLRSWTRPIARPIPPQTLNIKPPSQEPLVQVRTSHTETIIMEPRKVTVIELSTESKPTENLTEKALTTLASAKQAQIEEKERKDAREEESSRRGKAGADATLKKLQLEGFNPSELAAISAELHGVYGSADVALRNAREILNRKKVS